MCSNLLNVITRAFVSVQGCVYTRGNYCSIETAEEFRDYCDLDLETEVKVNLT
jgi:hypothetical protein